MVFQPDYMQRIVNVSWESGFWLAIEGGSDKGVGSTFMTLMVSNFNPSPSQFIASTLCSDEIVGNELRGNLTPEQKADPFLHFRNSIVATVQNGILLLNLSKIAQNFPNPTFQFDVTLTPDLSTADDAGGFVSCRIGEKPSRVNELFQGAPVVFKTSYDTEFRPAEFDTAALPPVPWVGRVFVDMSKIDDKFVGALSSVTLQVGTINVT